MYLFLLAITTALNIQCIPASQPFLELNPKLQRFQDLAPIFPLTEIWYVKYRNYEVDPVFGSAKCLRFDQDTPDTENSHTVNVYYDGIDEPVTAVLKLEASEGYTVNNVLKVVPDDGGDQLQYHLVYHELGVCSVTRNTYVNDDAFVVFVNQGSADLDSTSCDFVYTLLSGSSPEYVLYDESCTASE